MEKGYDKRPLWQWTIIYLAIAAVAYGLNYYFVFAGKGGYTPPTNTAQPTSAPAANQTTPPAKPSEMTVKLSEENNSGEMGEAILKEENGKTTVTVNLTGFTQGVSQPAHIHIGSCPGR